MNGAILLLVGVVCFTLAYFLYSRFIARAIGVDHDRPTPAQDIEAFPVEKMHSLVKPLIDEGFTIDIEGKE